MQTGMIVCTACNLQTFLGYAIIMARCTLDVIGYKSTNLWKFLKLMTLMFLYNKRSSVPVGYGGKHCRHLSSALLQKSPKQFIFVLLIYLISTVHWSFTQKHQRKMFITRTTWQLWNNAVLLFHTYKSHNVKQSVHLTEVKITLANVKLSVHEHSDIAGEFSHICNKTRVD